MEQEGSDGTLARVTYLFGGAAQGAVQEVVQGEIHDATHGAPSSEPSVARRVPTFDAIDDGDEVQNDDGAPAPAGPDHVPARHAVAGEQADTAVPATRKTRNGSMGRPANVSMNALARRGMSIAEMTRLLEQREVEPGDVSIEIARLEGVGLLDDRALAENLVRTLHERKGLGRSAISAELRRRKVDQSAIDEAIDDVTVDDELSRACALALKRAPQLRSLDQETARRRLSAYLMRRGYSGSIVATAIAQALQPSGGSRSGGSGPRFV